MSEGLWIPSKVAHELAEERALRAQSMRADSVLTFHETTLQVGGLQGSAGTAFRAEELLREIRGWVAIGLRPITDRMTSLEMHAHVEVDDDEDPRLPTTHPANAIIADPNPIFTFADLMGLVGAWLKIVGQGYLQVLHDGVGVPRELWPMPPDRVFPVPSTEDVIGGYVVYGTNGEQTFLEKEEVIRFWRPDPARIYQAEGDLAAQADVVNTELYRIGHLKSDYEQDSTPRVVFEPDNDAQPVTAEQREEFITSWRELNHRRRGRGRGVPAFGLPGFKLHELKPNADTAGSALIGDRTKEQILAAIGTPGSIAGMVVDVNRAAADANRAVFDRNTMKPITNRVERTFSQQLAPQFDSRIIYRFVEYEESDKEFDLQQEQSDLDRKVVTVNEIRQRRNLDPAEWGELPVGSFSDMPYSGEEDSGFESETDLTSGDEPRSRTRRHREAVVTDAMREAFSPDRAWTRLLKTERTFVKRFTNAMGRVFDTQRKTVVKRLRAQIPEPRARVFADDLFDVDEWGDLYRVNVRTLQEKILLGSAVEAFGIVSPGDEFIFNEVVQRRLDAMHAQMVRQVNQTTKDRISRALVEGQGKGESVDQLAKRISGEIVNRKRARTIARTEVGKASQLGQLESFAQSQVVEMKAWNTSRDGAVRDSHQIDGQTVDLDGFFQLPSGSRAAHPLDPTLPASDLINCRCFLTPVFVEDDGSEP